MGSMTIEGGCACGSVRYRLLDEPIFVNNCHCSLCQRQTGTASAVNAFIETDQIEHLSGDLSSHEVRTGSGGIQTIFRCVRCGTPLWAFYPLYGRAGAGVRVGTFDNPGAIRPDGAIFTEERPAWATLPEGIPAFRGYYDPAAILPADRLKRLRALTNETRSKGAERKRTFVQV